MLNDYNINNVAIINLVYKPFKNNNIIKVSITNISGEKLFLSVKPSNIIQNIKYENQNILGVDAKN